MDNWQTGIEAVKQLEANEIDFCLVSIPNSTRRCANNKCNKVLSLYNKDALCFACRKTKTRRFLGV